MGASGSKSSSKPVDLTPQAFENMQMPFADVLGSLLGYSRAAAPAPAPAPAAPTPTWPQQLFANTQQNTNVGHNAGHKNPRNNPFLRSLRQPKPAPAPAYGVEGDPNDPLRGIPSYPGDLTAPMTGNEGDILAQLMALMNSDAGNLTGAQNTLEELMAGQGPSGAGSYTPGSLEALMQERMGAFQTTGYDAEDGNPFLNAMIEAAQRPTLEGLEETLSRTLPGRFTQAGQFVQPGGSSAFDRAAAIATRGAGQTMADIASNLSFGSFEAERGRQFESQEAARAQESEAIAQEFERRGMFGEADRARKFAESEASRDRQLAAAQSAPAVQKQQVDSMIANLQAQALPRLIQDMGIERGLEQFNNQVNALLTTLGITAGVTRPVIGNKSSSSSAGISLK